MTRWSPTSAANARASRTSASRTTRSPWRGWRTRRTPSTAGAAAHPMSSTRSTSATSGTTTARPAALGARSRRSCASQITLDGVRAARMTLSTPSGSTEVGIAVPGLYNVYNALAAAALATSLGVPLQTIAEGLQATQAAFGRAETVSVAVPAGAGRPAGQREMRILLVKNPAGTNEVLRTLALEPGEHDVLGVLNDQIADGRDVSWIWDADFELLAGRIRRFTCSGSRARGPRDPPEVRGRGSRADPRRGGPAGGARRCRPRAAVRRRPAVRAADLHGDARAARAACRRGEAGSAWSLSRRPGPLARPGVRPLQRRPAAVARARGGRAPAAAADPGPRRRHRAGQRSRSREAGHEVIALDIDPELLAALTERAAGLAVRTVMPGRPQPGAARAESGARDRADADDPAARRRDWKAASCCTGVRRHMRAGGILACAIVTEAEEFDCAAGDLGPGPEVARAQDAIFVSRAVAVRVSRTDDQDRARAAGPVGGRRRAAPRCCAPNRT